MGITANNQKSEQIFTFLQIWLLDLTSLSFKGAQGKKKQKKKQLQEACKSSLGWIARLKKKPVETSCREQLSRTETGSMRLAAVVSN